MREFKTLANIDEELKNCSTLCKTMWEKSKITLDKNMEYNFRLCSDIRDLRHEASIFFESPDYDGELVLGTMQACDLSSISGTVVLLRVFNQYDFSAPQILFYYYK